MTESIKSRALKPLIRVWFSRSRPQSSKNTQSLITSLGLPSQLRFFFSHWYRRSISYFRFVKLDSYPSISFCSATLIKSTGKWSYFFILYCTWPQPPSIHGREQEETRKNQAEVKVTHRATANWFQRCRNVQLLYHICDFHTQPYQISIWRSC